MSGITIEETLADRESSFPRTARVCREMLALSPTALGGQLEYIDQRWGDRFWNRAERLIGLAEEVGGNPASSLVEYTMEYLRAQAMFVETESYTHADFETANREVYNNPDVMERFYLEGLMLSHAFWPIHFDMHDFFMKEFVSRVPDEGTGVEIGFGHGLYLLEVLTSRPGTRAKGFDISPYSQRYAAKLLQAGGVDASRFELGFADIRHPLECADAAFGWGIFAEILEHIPDPLGSLKELRRTLAPGAPVFLTTVVDSNAIDHLYQFEDVGAIRTLVESAGLEILAEKVMRVSEYGSRAGRDPSVDVALVARPAS